MQILLRLLLGGVLGILVGENPIALGLLDSPVFLPMVVWYIFLFLTFDWLIFKFKLSDRSFLLLAAILGILIGGILDKEFFAPTPQMGLLGLDPFSPLLLAFWWGVSYILIFHVINILIPRKQIFLGSCGSLIFIILTVLLLGVRLPEVLVTVNPLGVILLLIAALALFVWFNRARQSTTLDTRPVIQKSLKLSMIPFIFVILSTIFGPEGYILLSAIVVVIVLLVISRYQISI